MPDSTCKEDGISTRHGWLHGFAKHTSSPAFILEGFVGWLRAAMRPLGGKEEGAGRQTKFRLSPGARSADVCNVKRMPFLLAAAAAAAAVVARSRCLRMRLFRNLDFDGVQQLPPFQHRVSHTWWLARRTQSLAPVFCVDVAGKGASGSPRLVVRGTYCAGRISKVCDGHAGAFWLTYTLASPSSLLRESLKCIGKARTAVSLRKGFPPFPPVFPAVPSVDGSLILLIQHFRWFTISSSRERLSSSHVVSTKAFGMAQERRLQTCPQGRR
ncbi:uncharacterized protein IWZ02DRAFT_234702 [Phyllosticta citriasiana]|uniref:Uncharacterized protein n=1 Tax=Phyllosticta citriasiana TaxID=595635 RepID=A0ABR1KPQ8_9PEZI